MANLPEIERADQIDRDRWSRVMGQVLIQAIPYDARCLMVAAGFQEFERHARRFLAAHQFKQDDYRRMYAIMAHETMPTDGPRQ